MLWRTKKPPVPDEEVLVVYGELVENKCLAHYSANEKWYDEDGYRIGNVLAWMPVPLFERKEGVSAEDALQVFKKGSYEDVLETVAEFGHSEGDPELTYYKVDKEAMIARQYYINWDSNCGCTIVEDSVPRKEGLSLKELFEDAYETGEYTQFNIDIADNDNVGTLRTHIYRYLENKQSN